MYIRCTNLFLILFMLRIAGLPVYAQKKRDTKALEIYAVNAYLSKTINIAYTLDAPKEGAWGHSLQATDFKLISDAGFTAIRLPVQWVSRMDTAVPFTIDPQFLARIDWAISEALKNHLAIILDNHLDAELMKAPAANRERFLSLWRQLSAHYQNRSQQVMFEVMAEPRDQLDAVWNDYFKDALAIIRETNPNRPVIVGPSFYNLVYHLAELQLPADNYLIFTFHYYDPIQFTMQGETWFPGAKPEWVGTKWLGTEQEKNAVNYTMDRIADWAIKNHRPVFLGEFGAGDHADTTSRASYLAYIRQQAENRHFSWAVFNYAVDYSIYDQAQKVWHQTLLKALIPAGDH
jgi:endoglucanase